MTGGGRRHPADLAAKSMHFGTILAGPGAFFRLLTVAAQAAPALERGGELDDGGVRISGVIERLA